MKIIGIDYGRKKIGISVGDSNIRLAEPLKVINVDTTKEALEKIARLTIDEQADKVVVGISEGKMAGETKIFVKGLLEKIILPIVLHDETLSTKEAQVKSIEAGMKKSKRKRLEDAFASAIMLQSYLDEL
jgi:putative Holliday junction resolvase